MKSCFVIMPFNVRDSDLPNYRNDRNHWTEVYEGLIKPAVMEAGLICERDDDDYRSRLILENIWHKIEAADIILCDLSSSNPNTLLEFGWTLRSDKRFVLIKDEVTPIQFDLNQHFTFIYSSGLQPTQLRKDIPQLSNVINKTLNDQHRAYSLVKKMELDLRLIKEAEGGNIEAELLQVILSEVRKPNKTNFQVDNMRSSLRVKIYWHGDDGITLKEAYSLKEILAKFQVDSAISRHINPNRPDAVFININAPADIVSIVFKNLPYVPEYIFPINYPSYEAGADSRFAVSIGLHSDFRTGKKNELQEPYVLSLDNIKFLRQLNNSDEDLRNFLLKVAPPRLTNS